jgi:hypothetical protein
MNNSLKPQTLNKSSWAMGKTPHQLDGRSYGYIMKTNINMGRWNEEEDKYLIRMVIEGVRHGSTQQEAFERAGFALSRTSRACAFRWNSKLRAVNNEAFKEARKEYQFKSGKIRSVRVPDYYAIPEYHASVEAEVTQVHPEPVQMAWSDDYTHLEPNPIKPAHYHKGGIDIIGFLESHFGQENGYTVIESFCIGNIVKYVTRYKMKNGMEDLNKAEYYLNKLKQQQGE